jgi:hypothetical protein
LLETVRAPRQQPPTLPPPPGPPPPPAEPPPIPRRGNAVGSASGEIISKPLDAHRVIMSPVPRAPSQVEMPESTEEITQPGVGVVHTPPPGAVRAKTPSPAPPNAGQEPRGAILGIGTSAIGHSGSSSIASGEIPAKMNPGQRVLVPGPNGLMQSATIRQLLQGYYELEVGSSGETIWVPMNGVVPE